MLRLYNVTYYLIVVNVTDFFAFLGDTFLTDFDFLGETDFLVFLGETFLTDFVFLGETDFLLF